VRGLTGGGFKMSLVAFFRALTAVGPKYIVLTDGSRGAFVATKEEILHCPAAKCPVIGTAGAGDAFAATFTALVTLGRSASDALRAATLNAASVVGYVDTQTGLLKSDALEAALSDPAQTLSVRRWPLKAA
jgi:ribokinase